MALEVITSIPDEYDGRCKLILAWGSNEERAVFPNSKEARHAASLALNPLFGGYHEARIEITDDDVTHETGLAWIYG